MSNQDQTHPNSPRAQFEQAITLAKSGHKSRACQMLREIVALQPVNQVAWLWLSAVTSNKAEAESALAQAKRINPAHSSLPKAEQWLVHRFSASSHTKQRKVVKDPPRPQTSPKGSKNWLKALNSLALGLVILALLVGLFVLVLGLISEVNAAPQVNPETPPHVSLDTIVADGPLKQAELTHLDSAQSRQDWASVIVILEKAYRQHPDSRQIKTQLSDAYFQKGISLRSRGFVEAALVDFEKALELTPNRSQIEQERHLAFLYLAGTRDYQAGRWQEAINQLEGVWQKNSNYPHIRDLLYSAYYNQALARRAAGEYSVAKQALEAAVALRPDLSDPRWLMAELEFAMTPDTPLSRPISNIEDRIIVVGIVEQKMVVYDGNQQVFDFVVSTGEPGRDTIPGDFEIQNKIDVAYASTWNLDMPYWMGIYWAGPLQNGIHALPIVKHNGYKLWDGYLGQRVSYGCVILSDDDAATLYDWTEVGTKVKIVPSLADWSPREERQ